MARVLPGFRLGNESSRLPKAQLSHGRGTYSTSGGAQCCDSRYIPSKPYVLIDALP